MKCKVVKAHHEAEKLIQAASGSRGPDGGKKFPTPEKGKGVEKLKDQGGHAAKKNGKTARQAAKDADGWADVISLLHSGSAGGVESVREVAERFVMCGPAGRLP